MITHQQALGAPDTVKPIVVIDDDQDVREVLADLLVAEGYRVRCFANGADALASLRRDSSASLILLDLMMPVMNGWRFREEQARDRRLASIPVIAMSACADLGPSTIPRPLALVAKPFNVDNLLARIAERVRPH
jgi:CheY-like chemotaxis protein